MPLKIQQTITLRGPVEWEAKPIGGPIERVEFLIDGKVAYTEKVAPYRFGGDAGALDTRTLADGPHTFRARAFAPGSDVAVSAGAIGGVVANGGVVTPPQAQPPAEPTPQPQPTPPSGARRAGLLAVGARLPSGAEAAAMVRRNPWEPRPDNAAKNSVRGRTYGGNFPGGYEGGRHYQERVDGNFTGTTNEIIQWGAFKWGIDEDIVRAMACNESGSGSFGSPGWNVFENGDDGHSWGLLQVKDLAWPQAMPMAKDSTAFNVDHALCHIRLNFEALGWQPNLKGDIWGCVGNHFSGSGWEGSQGYVDSAKRHLEQKPWKTWQQNPPYPEPPAA